jgi:pimeloyl-ACP methyl ester carboxylesterase
MRRAMSDENSRVLAGPHGAGLKFAHLPQQPTAVVLMLHGGSVTSTRSPGWWTGPVARMVPMARSIGRRSPDVAVALLKHAVGGWNGSGSSALRDADWALDLLRTRFADQPIGLVGHSMGGRTAAQRVSAESVVGAVLLTPWLPPSDPVGALAGRTLVVLQAEWDHTCPAAETEPWLTRAATAGAVIDREILSFTDHAMLLRFPTWHRLTARGVGRVLGEPSAS